MTLYLKRWNKLPPWMNSRPKSKFGSEKLALPTLQNLPSTNSIQDRNFSGSYQRNRMPLAKHLRQTPFFRLWLRASPVRLFLNLNWRPWLRVLNTLFFTITWKATYIDKSVLRNIEICYQNKNPSDLLQGLFHSLKLKEVVFSEAIF